MFSQLKKGRAMLKKDPYRLFGLVTGIRISYSQMGEDLILSEMIDKSSGFYVDIGANQPVKLNNFYLFYKKGRRGINVEPNTVLWKKLQSKRSKDLNLNIGIGKGGHDLEFYTMNPDTLSTFNKDVALDYEKKGYSIVSHKKVPIITLESLFDKHVGHKHIDILSVDVEGYDMEVLESNNWEKYKPQYVILETVEHTKNWSGKKLNDIYDPYLASKGYVKIADTYINTIYKRK